jgi:small subunit ribosomal protein S17e
VGRIKTKKIKRATQKIFAQNKDLMSTKYEDNKKVVNERYEIVSKKLRNTIAGYCTRLKKQQEM